MTVWSLVSHFEKNLIFKPIIIKNISSIFVEETMTASNLLKKLIKFANESNIQNFGVKNLINSNFCINSYLNLTTFVYNLIQLLISTKFNIFVFFSLIDTSKPCLVKSSLHFIIKVRPQLLSQYSNQKRYIYLIIDFYFECLLGYTRVDTFMLLAYCFFGLIDPLIIDLKLAQNISNSKVMKIKDLTYLFISSFLGFVPKYNEGSQKIYHLSYPKNSSVNDYINTKSLTLSYTLLQQIFSKIIKARRDTVLRKRDVKDVFQNMHMASHMQQLLRFLDKKYHYQETYLLFGLLIIPIIYNLFAKAFHQILKAIFQLSVNHYSDNFIVIVMPRSCDLGYTNVTVIIS